jgi:hypothetical protein
MEMFKEIKGYEGLYKVSTLGNIFSIRNKRLLKPIPNKTGYLTIVLCKDKIKTRYYIHRLVAGAFINNPKDKPQVNHINGFKDDNSYSNLEWCTSKENLKHARELGLSNPIGEDAYRAKLTNEDVRNIKRLNSIGFLSQKLIAKKYGVTQSNISNIVNNKTFK